MQGLGNDFLVIDAVRRPANLSPAQVRRLADRHFGVGFDQLLLIEPPVTPGTDFYYRIFNSDGAEVEQCGNGLRCFARYVHDHGLTEKTRIAVETLAGIAYPQIEADRQVSVEMGVPVFEPEKIPFLADHQDHAYELEIGNQRLTLSVLSMGNPHAVIMVRDLGVSLADAPVATLGAAVCAHPRFPNRVNVGFCQTDGNARISLRVFERGAGETLACGTGACAAVVACRLRGLVTETVSVRLTGGELQVSWPGPGAPVLMTGPAEEVFAGTISL